MNKTTRRNSPHSKKQSELERNHHSSSEHGMRKKWSRLKSTKNRKERHEVVIATNGLSVNTSDQSSLDDLDIHVDVSRTRRPKMDSLASVGNRVTAKTQSWVWLFGYRRYFSNSYESVSHRKSFKQFLVSIMQGRTTKSKRLATYYLACLDDNSLKRPVVCSTENFLRAFAKDESAFFNEFLGWANRISKEK